MELRRLQKTKLIADFPKQRQLQQFMIDAINQVRKYFPMIRTLRTKGLVSRHWKMVGQDLGVVIHPDKVTLHKLVQFNMHDDEVLKVIKQVCEVATKEYAVGQQLGSLEREIKCALFTLETLQDAVTQIIIGLPELICEFEDYLIRAGVLRSNPNIRNFIDKLIDLEKTIRNTLELLNEWVDFQRNYVYLFGIFNLGEMRSQMPTETRLFLEVKRLFDLSMTEFKDSPQVFKISLKDSFLATLNKANSNCEFIRRGLRQYLEKKRGQFPRLFFLSNEELIEIFGQGIELVRSMSRGESQAFINTLFEGVNRLQFDPATFNLSHIISKDGEVVRLTEEVRTNMHVDNWLNFFELEMVRTLKHFVFHAFRHQDQQGLQEWIASWPGQAVYVASEVWFGKKVHAIFAGSVEREVARATGGGSEKTSEKEQSPEEEQAAQSGSDTEEHKQQVPRSAGAPDPLLTDDMAEPDTDAARAYSERIHRQIAKDMEHAREQAQLEKVLRLKRRFRVNRHRSVSRSINDLQLEIAGTILEFTEMVRKKLTGPVRQSTVALLTKYVHFRDILNGLLKHNVQGREEFRWQIQFRFEALNLQECVYKSAFEPEDEEAFETQKLEIDCEVFNSVRKYGFEYLGNCPRLVITPLTERCQRSLIVALQHHYGGAPEGPFGTGKTETTKDLARQIAKICFVMNCSASYEYVGICRFFKGLASSGAWVCFDEFNRMEPKILAMIAQVLIALQTALRAGAPDVLLDETRVQLRSDCAVFITLNPVYAGRNELPMNLRALFRQVAMVVPDASFITEILLYSSGFIGAQTLAKKMVSVQSLANEFIK